MTEEKNRSCAICGATIYPEHIDTGKAVLIEGKLMCAVCVEEQKAEPAARLAITESDEEALSLVDEEEFESSGRMISAFGAEKKSTVEDDSNLHRSLQKTGTGATRLKVFHSKMNEGAVEFMIHLVNEWVDSNPDVEIKNVQSTVGMWEGKHSEAHLILTVWY
jgi:hypothetical protein